MFRAIGVGSAKPSAVYVTIRASAGTEAIEVGMGWTRASCGRQLAVVVIVRADIVIRMYMAIYTFSDQVVGMTDSHRLLIGGMGVRACIAIRMRMTSLAAAIAIAIGVDVVTDLRCRIIGSVSVSNGGSTRMHMATCALRIRAVSMSTSLRRRIVGGMGVRAFIAIRMRMAICTAAVEVDMSGSEIAECHRRIIDSVRVSNAGPIRIRMHMATCTAAIGVMMTVIIGASRSSEHRLFIVIKSNKFDRSVCESGQRQLFVALVALVVSLLLRVRVGCLAAIRLVINNALLAIDLLIISLVAVGLRRRLAASLVAAAAPGCSRRRRRCHQHRHCALFHHVQQVVPVVLGGASTASTSKLTG